MRRRDVLGALGAVALGGWAVMSGPSSTRTEESRRQSPLERGEPTPTGAEETDPRPVQTSTDTVATSTDEYEVVHDVVSDLGCAPDGSEPCDEHLSAALGDRVAFRFPPGRYQFDGRFRVEATDRIGLLGSSEGDVELVPPDGFNSYLINFSDVGRATVRNLSIDLTATSTTAGIRCITADGFQLDEITYRGRGTHTSESVVHALALAVTNADASGTLRNVVARKGSATGHYKGGNGRGGVWIGRDHRGTAYIRDCVFCEFGNNGLYTSRAPGDIRVHGGTYENNNVSAVRISGDGSYVTGAEITVDLSEYSGPRTRLDSAFASRGVAVEQGPLDNPPGAVVENTTVDIRETPSPGPAVSVWPTGKTVSITDSTLRVAGDSPVVHRKTESKQGSHAPATGARSVSMVDTTVEGSGPGPPLVVLRDASDSLLRNCDIRSDSDRVGMALIRSPRMAVRSATIDTGGYPIVVEEGLRSSAECLLSISPSLELRTGLEVAPNRTRSIRRGDLTTPAATSYSELSESEGVYCLSATDLELRADSVGYLAVTGFTDESLTYTIVEPA